MALKKTISKFDLRRVPCIHAWDTPQAGGLCRGLANGSRSSELQGLGTGENLCLYFHYFPLARGDTPWINPGASRSSRTECNPLDRGVPACGSDAVAPSEPIVGSISVGGWWALDLRHRLVHQTFYTLVLLPEGTISLGTHKHSSVVCVLETV